MGLDDLCFLQRFIISIKSLELWTILCDWIWLSKFTIAAILFGVLGIKTTRNALGEIHLGRLLERWPKAKCLCHRFVLMFISHTYSQKILWPNTQHALESVHFNNIFSFCAAFILWSLCCLIEQNSLHRENGGNPVFMLYLDSNLSMIFYPANYWDGLF